MPTKSKRSNKPLADEASSCKNPAGIAGIDGWREVTGCGAPAVRGAIAGVATTIGGMLHTFPFLISNLPIAHDVAYTGIRAARHRLHSIPAHEGKSSCNDLASDCRRRIGVRPRRFCSEKSMPHRSMHALTDGRSRLRSVFCVEGEQNVDKAVVLIRNTGSPEIRQQRSLLWN